MIRCIEADLVEALGELVRRHTCRGGDNQRDIAEALGVGPGQLQHWLHGRTALPLPVAVSLHRTLDDDYLTQAYAHKCGGVFVPVPDDDSAPKLSNCMKAMNLLADTCREQGEALAASSEVLADRVATPEEKARVRREILEAISAMTQLLRAIDSLPASGGFGRASSLAEAG